MRTTMTILGGILLLVSNGANAAPTPSPVPRWSWLEVAYGVNFDTPYPVSEQRDKSSWGARATGSFLVTPHLYLRGSYDLQRYDATDDSSGSPLHDRETFTASKYGLGTYIGLWDGAVATLEASSQERWFKAHFDDLGLSEANFADASRGFGIAAGVRAIVGGGAEIAASYELAPLKGNVNGNNYKENYQTASVSVAAPLSPRVSFTLGFEQVTYTDKSGTAQTTLRNENFLFGLRLAI